MVKKILPAGARKITYLLTITDDGLVLSTEVTTHSPYKRSEPLYQRDKIGLITVNEYQKINFEKLEQIVKNFSETSDWSLLSITPQDLEVCEEVESYYDDDDRPEILPIEKKYEYTNRIEKSRIEKEVIEEVKIPEPEDQGSQDVHSDEPPKEEENASTENDNSTKN